MQIFCKSSSTKIEFQFLQEVHWKTLLPTPSLPDFYWINSTRLQTLISWKKCLVTAGFHWDAKSAPLGQPSDPKPWVPTATPIGASSFWRVHSRWAASSARVISRWHACVFHCWSVQLLTSLPDTCVFPCRPGGKMSTCDKEAASGKLSVTATSRLAPSLRVIHHFQCMLI